MKELLKLFVGGVFGVSIVFFGVEVWGRLFGKGWLSIIAFIFLIYISFFGIRVIVGNSFEKEISKSQKQVWKSLKRYLCARYDEENAELLSTAMMNRLFRKHAETKTQRAFERGKETKITNELKMLKGFPCLIAELTNTAKKIALTKDGATENAFKSALRPFIECELIKYDDKLYSKNLELKYYYDRMLKKELEMAYKNEMQRQLKSGLQMK